MPTPLPDIAGAPHFREASERTLTYLREVMPLSAWSITRIENGRQTHLHLGKNGYGIVQGDTGPWENSFCINMSRGLAPRIAPDAQQIPLYRDAPVNQKLTIGAYAGSPLLEPDGSLFGVICGFDPHPQNDSLRDHEATLALLGQLLTMSLAQERHHESFRQLLTRERLMGETDVLTGLPNRRAWERTLLEEKERFERLGDPTTLVMIDLDRLKHINDDQGHAAGDDYLRRAGDALRAATRQGDFVARLGGDEFGILLPQCTEDEVILERIQIELTIRDVSASVGWAPLTIACNLEDVLKQADDAMYADKASRRK